MANSLSCQCCKGVYLTNYKGIFEEKYNEFFRVICPSCREIKQYVVDYIDNVYTLDDLRLIEFEEQAKVLGARYFENPKQILKKYTKTDLFYHKKLRLSNCLEWEAELLEYKIHLFDYILDVSDYEVSFSVFALDSQKIGLPEMKVIPREDLDMKVGFEFYNNLVFNEKFNIIGDNKVQIRKILSHSDLIDFFIANPDFTFECENYYAFFYHKFRLIRGNKIASIYAKVQELLQILMQIK